MSFTSSSTRLENQLLIASIMLKLIFSLANFYPFVIMFQSYYYISLFAPFLDIAMRRARSASGSEQTLRHF